MDVKDDGTLFQSTLPHGERLIPSLMRRFISDFNPRSRTGSDGAGDSLGRGCLDISIHAPARGATRLHCFVFL